MINFLRKVRQKMLNENKFSKYLIYAVGEIVLVVIGILIALQINNWNQIVKAKQVEQNYLSNVLCDLKYQHTSIDIQMAKEQSYFKAAGQIIKSYQKHNDFVLDSAFFKNATAITERKTFVITDPTYTDLISSGNINTLKNIENKNNIIKYYQDLERVEKIIQSNNSLLVDQNYVYHYSQIGYFSPTHVIGDKANVTKLNEHMVIPSYQTEFEEIAKMGLQKAENKLTMMNAIHLRNILAIGHYVLLQDIQSATLSLIKDIEALTTD